MDGPKERDVRYCDALAAALDGYGVRYVFGVLGDANMHYGDAFTQYSASGRFVSNAHEGGAILAAAGYAALSGDVGVATVTHGAITNCVTALADAVRAGYPMIVLCGDTTRAQGDSLQNLPHRSIVAPTGAGFIDVRAADDVLADLGRAFAAAAAESRPVVVNIPTDYQTRPCDPGSHRPIPPPAGSGPASRDLLEEAVAAVVTSRRPVVLVGRGARGETAIDSAGEFARRIGAPVATTLRGQGLLADDPFNLGICGSLSTPVASRVIAESDCVVVFGASLNPLTTLGGDLFRNTRIIQIDRDRRALGRYVPVDVGLVGDAQQTATRLIEILDEIGAQPTSARSATLAEEIGSSGGVRGTKTRSRTSESLLDIHDVLEQIESALPADRSLVVDVGRFAHVALRILRVTDPRRYIHAGSIGQIGLSVGYGVGAATAHQGPTAVVVGDGGFMLGGLAEFNTAVRESLDLIVFVINDRAYGAEYYRLIQQDMNTDLVTFDWPDLARVARSLGGQGVSVKSAQDLLQIGQAIQGRQGPLLFDISVDRESVPEPGIH